MTKRTAYVHVGLPHGGGSFLPLALREHAEVLAACGLHLPARSEDEMFRAAVELRGDHRAWGLRRRDVEGTWAGVCRRAWKATSGGGRVYVGHDLLAGANREEVALLVDGLAGFDLHVVITVGPPDGRLSLLPDDHDLESVLERWAAPLRSPDRMHVVVTDPADLTATWATFGRVVGLETSALGLPVGLRPAVHDLGALRLVASDSAALASRAELRDAVERWAKVLASGGYDVHGDVATLAPAPAPEDLPVVDRLTLATGALDESIAELARLRRRVVDLEAANRKLEKKRKKLKHRLADATR